MAVNAIDNTQLVDYNRQGTPIAIFQPKVSFTYNAGTKVVEAWDGSTFPSGDGLKIAHLSVTDNFGGEVKGSVSTTGAGGKATLDITSLQPSEGIRLTATVITNKGLIADGSFRNMGAAGDLFRWDKDEHKL